jgi:hypothetical protein
VKKDKLTLKLKKVGGGGLKAKVFASWNVCFRKILRMPRIWLFFNNYAYSFVG